MMEAIRHLSDGTIGDVYMARALCYKWRPSIGHAKEEPFRPALTMTCGLALRR